MSDMLLGPKSKFKYVSASKTNIRKTFERLRKEAAKPKEEPPSPPNNVPIPIKRKEG